MRLYRNTTISPFHRLTLDQRWIRCCIIVLIGLVYGMNISVASAKDRFFWNSYNRGSGTAPHLMCRTGSQVFANRCFSMRCQPGFKAIGEVCHAGMISSPRLETGRPSLSCGYKVLDDGACYDRCRAGYYGSGEICHGREHPGYVKCGAGEAASYSMCSYVRRQQMLATINVNHGISGIWHIKLPPVYGQHVRQARGLIQELSNEVAPLKAELLPLFDEIAHGQHYDRAIQEASVDVNHYLTGARGRNIGKKLHQLAPGIVGASYKWDSTGDKSPMLEARLIFSITSKIDPKARIIAAYAYPISAPAVPRNESQVVNPSVRIHSKDLQQNTSAAPPMPANDVPGF